MMLTTIKAKHRTLVVIGLDLEDLIDLAARSRIITAETHAGFDVPNVDVMLLVGQTSEGIAEGLRKEIEKRFGGQVVVINQDAPLTEKKSS
jgi:F420-0:gamma-glutamyl ligase-like protein